MTARDCATAAHLVRLLDSLSSPSPSPPPYLALLNYAATARQARKVLDRLLLGLNDNDDDSQHRTLLLDLDTRLSAAEQQLARLAPAQSGSSSSTLLSPPAETIRAYRDSDPLLASLADLADLAVLPSQPPPPPPPLRASSPRRKSSSSSSSSSTDPRTKDNLLLATAADSNSLESASSQRNEDAARNRTTEPSKPSAADLRAASALVDRPPPPTPATQPPPTRPILASSNPGASSSSSSSSLNPSLTTARPRRPQQQPTTLANSNPSGIGTGTGLATNARLRDNEEEEKKPPVPAYLAAKRARAAAAAKKKEKEKLAASAASDSEKALADELAADDDDDPDDDAAVIKKLDDLIPADSTPVGAAGNDLLGQHHALQTSLLSSLTSLSGALKQSTLSFSDNLAKDKEVVTRAQEQLEQSEQGMKKQQGRLKDVRGKSRGTTYWTLGLLAIVFMLWFLTFLLIKVT
ncbi:hypothetical protein B0A53_04977 [Rhodotorula sp. CCFEE 5036]|nr:hypothetical protein B0A53_04977 [Rhodotorula sp. CCFEE 5036]